VQQGLQKMDDDFDDDITVIYTKNLVNIEKLIEDHDPLAVAGVMIAQAFSIYRTALSDEQYNEIIDEILKRKSAIRKFTGKGSITLQ
jgi:hypothetical protein